MTFKSTIPQSGVPLVELENGAVNPAWYRFWAQFYKDALTNSLSQFSSFSVLGNGLNGSAYPVNLQASANGQFLQRDADALVFRYPKLPSFTVATLPSASTQGAGTRVFVTDANATTFASVVAGGGANGVPAYSDGTNWRIG